MSPSQSLRERLLRGATTISAVPLEFSVRLINRFSLVSLYSVVSEISWITNSRPKELEEYWNKEYPEIDTASNKIRILEENGYSPVGYFILSQNSLIDNYYKPMEKRFPAFLEKHNNSEMASNIVKEHKGEIRKYEKYKDYYSYGFYIAKKI